MPKRAVSSSVRTSTSSVPQHATHIVLFKSPSERNEAAIAKAMHVRTTVSLEGLSSAKTMLAPRAPQTMARMYDQLAVAAVVASPSELEALSASPEVEEIFVNEERTIPPMPTRQGIRGDSDASPDGLNYLRGLRDGLNLALDTFEGKPIKQPDGLTSRGRKRSAFEEISLSWGLQAIGITTTTYPFKGTGAIVAVLDTGVDLQHPDLQSRFRNGANTRSFIRDETVQDGNGHGTHCIGVVGGPQTSRSGPRYGVAPDCTILAGKVLNNAGSGFDDGIIEGIQWAIDNGAQVISISLGSARDVDRPFNRLYERLAERALEGNPGTLIVAAAGNESQRPRFISPVGNPAACPSIMAIAAIDREMSIASFSCGTKDGIGKIDLAAPGVDILSSVPGGTDRFNGTSMATPFVAGIAALNFEAMSGPTARAVWDRLINDARSLGDPNDFGAGIVQAPRSPPVTT